MSVIANPRYINFNKNGSIITFFTPTFNRAEFLRRIYECLKKQTDKRFVWIIVNDGSTDNTDEIVQEILNCDLLPIKYISQKNGGKHSAFKAAFNACETRYFQCMDDDDIYSVNAVEVFLKIWERIENDKLEDIGAIRTLSRRPDGTFVCNFSVSKLSEEIYEDCSTLEMNYIKRKYQENWTCYRTSALKEIDLFPTGYWMADEHKFYSENLWQSRFARRFKCRYVQICLREYRDDSVTSIIRSSKSRQHYLDMFINAKLQLEEQIDWIAKDKLGLFKQVILIQLLRNYLKIKHKDLVTNTESKKLIKLFKLLRPISPLSKLIITLRNN